MGRFIPISVILFLHGIRVTTSGSFNFELYLADGSYTLGVDNLIFLKSADTFFRADKTLYSLNDGSLKLTSQHLSSGRDAHGDYEVITNYYTAGSANVSTSFTIYQDVEAVVCSQTYHNGAKGTRASTFDQTISGFPSAQVESSDSDLGYLSFDGFMSGDTKKHIGRWNSQTDAIGDGMKGGPLAVFDEQGRTFLLSSFSGFMVSSAWHDAEKDGTMFWGIMGGVDEVPANYTYSTIIYYAEGINKAFKGWGEFLQKQYGEKEWYTWEDSTLIFLGYWTDNGGYYYFQTEPNKTYEQTMSDLINQEVTKAGLPIGYVQYDSWWYYTGTGNGIKSWDPRPDIFPDGLDEYGVFSYEDPESFRVFDEKTGLKLPVCTKEDFCLYHFPPKISHSGHEIYLLGEMEKWVPVNKMRTVGINYLEDDLLINIFGKYGSNATLHYVIDGHLTNATCQIRNRLWNCVSLITGKCNYDNFFGSDELGFY